MCIILSTGYPVQAAAVDTRTTMQRIKATLSNPKSSVQQYANGLTKTATFFNFISIACTAVFLAIEDKQWASVDEVNPTV